MGTRCNQIRCHILAPAATRVTHPQVSWRVTTTDSSAGTALHLGQADGAHCSPEQP